MSKPRREPPPNLLAAARHYAELRATYATARARADLAAAELKALEQPLGQAANQLLAAWEAADLRHAGNAGHDQRLLAALAWLVTAPPPPPTEPPPCNSPT